MTTIRELLTDALSLFGAYGVGEDPTDDDLQDAFRSHKSMRGWMANNRLLRPVAADSLFTWGASIPSKTIGAAGDFVVAAGKPLTVEDAFVRIDANDYPVTIITKSDYEDLVQKDLSSSIPGYLMYDPGEGNTIGTLYLWPVPSQDVQVNISYIAPMLAYTSIDDTFADPEGYEEMEKYNLALRLCGRYGKSLSETDQQIAKDTLAAVKRTNSNMDEMEIPPGLGAGRYWNAKSDWWA